MRYIRHALLFILLLFIIFDAEIGALAMNTGFSTEILSEYDINIFLNNVSMSVLKDEPPKKAIECFAVNKDGLIAVGCSEAENKTICIYTRNGEFQCGYRFKCDGRFGVEFDDNVLIICFVRSDVMISVDSDGKVQNILKIQNTSANDAYWNNCIFLNKRKIGGVEYTLRNNMGIFNVFSSSYSQLIITNEVGEKSIIYDVNSLQFLNMILVFIGIIFFVSLCVIIVIRQFIKLKYL